MLTIAWCVQAFAQDFSSQPVPTLQTVIINGQLHFRVVRGSYIFDPFNLFLTAQQANGFYKPIGYVPGWNEIIGKPDFSQYIPISAINQPNGVLGIDVNSGFSISGNASFGGIATYSDKSANAHGYAFLFGLDSNQRQLRYQHETWGDRLMWGKYGTPAFQGIVTDDILTSNLKNYILKTAIGTGLNFSNGVLSATAQTQDLSAYLTTSVADNTFQAKGDYLANGALNGYATQTYVNNQGFLTSAPVTSVFNRTGAIAANQTDYQAFYPLLSGAYNDPTWINSLAGSKVTGLGNGAFLNASMDSRATSLVQRGNTGSIVVNEIDASYLRAVFPIETALLPNSILGIYSEPGMKSAARAFPLSTIAQSLQLGSMSKQDTSKFIKREYLQDMASFNRTGQFTGSSTDPANPLAGLGSTGIGVSVLSMFEGPNNGSQLILSNGYNTQTHRYFDAHGSMFANGSLHITHFLLDNNFRDYVYSKGYIDTAFNNFTLPYSRVTGAPASLSFTPVQQGGGIGQMNNKIYVGWNGSFLKTTVDGTDLGRNIFAGNNISLLTNDLAFVNALQAAAAAPVQMVANKGGNVTLGEPDITNLTTDLAGKEPTITAGTAAQYIDGTKKLQTLNTTVVPEGTNIYFTTARARNSFTGAGTVTVNPSNGVITGTGADMFNAEVLQNGTSITVSFAHGITGVNGGSVLTANPSNPLAATNFQYISWDSTNVYVHYSTTAGGTYDYVVTYKK